MTHAGEMLDGQDFSGQALNGADFRNASLKKAAFRHCNLSSADFSGADLTDAILEGATAFGTKFTGASLVRAQATGANLSYGDFTDADLQDADLSGVEFEEALGPRANFDRAILRRCAFFGGHYEHATLRQADLTEARLYGADFTAADFTEARLVGTRMTDPVLDDACFDGALIARDEAEVAAGQDVLSARKARVDDMLGRLVACQEQYLAQPGAQSRRAFAQAWQALFDDPGFQSMPSSARTQARVDAAKVHLQGFEISGDGDDLALAMEQWRLALLEFPPEQSAARPSLAKVVAQLFMDRFRATQRFELLAQGVPWLLRVLSEIDAPADQQAEFLYDLGNQLRVLRRQTGEMRAIDLAADCHLRATQLVDQTSARQPEYRDTLAIDHSVRYEDRQQQADLDAAIDAWCEAVRLAAGIAGFDASHLADYRVNVAGAYQRRFERGGALADLDAAIDSLETVLRGPSIGHAAADALLGTLTGLLLRRHGLSKDIADLDRLIGVHRGLLQRAADAPQSLNALVPLAQLLATRFDATQRDDDLAQAIHTLAPALDAIVAQRALAGRDEAKAAGCLADLLHRRYQRARDGAALTAALSWTRRALAAAPHGDAAESELLGALAVRLRLTYVRERNGALIDEAIEAGRRSLALAGPEATDLARVKAGLGGDLLIKVSAAGTNADRAALDEAIDTLRAAIDEGEADGTLQPLWLHNLATGLRLRFRQYGDQADAARAVDTWRRALRMPAIDFESTGRMIVEMMTEAPAELAEIASNGLPGLTRFVDRLRDEAAQAARAGAVEKAAEIRLALAGTLLELDAGGRQAHLEEAIKLAEDLLGPGGPVPAGELGVVHDLLCRAYVRRTAGSHAENLEAAIRHGEAALTDPSHDDWPEFRAARLTNLASAYLERGHGDRAENIELALRHAGRALEVRTRVRYPLQWSSLQNAIGIMHLERVHGSRDDNVEQAIACFERSLEVRTREAFPGKWADTVTHLANAYRQRKKGDAAENFEKAIALYRRTLEVRTKAAWPTHWLRNQLNLAATYLDRVEGTPADNARHAMEGLRLAQAEVQVEADPFLWGAVFHNLAEATLRIGEGDRPVALQSAIEHYRQAVRGFTADAFPSHHLTSQQRLGEALCELERWDDAHQAFTAAAAVSNTLYAESFTEFGRHAELAKVGRLHALDAWCLLRLGHFDDALERLERGRTRVLSEALALDAAALGRLDATERDAIGTARDSVRALENQMRSADELGERDDRALAEALAHARRQLAASIQQVRAAHPAFLPESLSAATILHGIPPGSALVAPVLTPAGTAVFVVPAGQQTVAPGHVLWLDFDEAASRALLTDDWVTGYFNRESQPGAWHDVIASTGHALWNKLMGPVADRLAKLDIRSVLLMPQGGLGLLPLHAAWREEKGQRRYFVDDHIVTYVVGSAVRTLCVERLQRARAHGMVGASLLAVVDPTHDLPYASLEGEHVARMFRADRVTLLPGDAATPDAVRHTAATHVHFACHGHYDWAEPMRSALQLAKGEPLSLAQVMGEVQFDRTQLVALSACETGISDICATPDEYVGLPAGFLLAGAPAVVSTLWAVNDLSTALLMGRFYALLFDGRHDGAAALAEAQRWLRDVTAAELTRLFAAEEEAVLGGTTSVAIEAISASFTRFAREAPSVRPFQEPFHWAAFTYMGA